ncbi:MAG: hypothetical protein R6V40_03700 [Candidatus Moraniibacteriota bacterium]
MKEMIKKIDKKMTANLIIIAALFFGGGFFLNQYLENGTLAQTDLAMPQAKEKAEEFIKGNLVQEGTDVKVKGIAEENDLYKVTVEVQGQEFDSYLTKDGKSFFPQAMKIEEMKEQAEAQKDAEEEANKPVPKSEKPKVEAFVMSYCPYGTQVQKGLLPVIETLDDKIDFDFRFVDYAMHQEKEVDENLRQYCIEQNNKETLYDYLDCFLKSEDSESCLGEAQVDQAALSSCVEKTDKEYNITKNLEDTDSWDSQFPPFNIHKDLNEKYGVQGSPTLVINETQTSSARDPQSLLNKVCEAFEEKPAECDAELSSETPSSGFGEGEASASATDAGCGA